VSRLVHVAIPMWALLPWWLIFPRAKREEGTIEALVHHSPPLMADEPGGIQSTAESELKLRNHRLSSLLVEVPERRPQLPLR
jgi:hypothetical protein